MDYGYPMLMRVQERPGIYVTYNGDNFDWPFIAARATHHGLSVFESLGFRAAHSGEFVSKNAVHMDCLCWVNRDSYLPQGSRGLKVRHHTHHTKMSSWGQRWDGRKSHLH